VLGLKIGFQFGLALEVSGDLAAGPGWFGLAVLAAAAAAYALAGYAQLRALVAAAVAGAAGWGVYGLLVQVFHSGPVLATGVAAIVVGAAAGLARRRGGIPPLTITLAGITPLLPGYTAYRGFYQLAVEGVAGGLVTITVALGIGLALAAGVALGDVLTRPRERTTGNLTEPAARSAPQ
jgi:uncharacterized membrane protein YjjB (DUF3815 family)